MSEVRFKFRTPGQDEPDDRVQEKQRRAGRKPSRLGHYLGHSISLVTTAILAVGLEAYSSQHFGSAQGTMAAPRHEVARLRQSAGRRRPGQAIWGRRTSGGPNCDCNGVHAGLLDAQYREDCLNSEQKLRELYAAGKLGLIAEKGRLVAGNFCSSNSGPRAWPVANGPALKPSGIPEGVPCTPSGIARICQ